jgi:hypothetical protein
MIRSDRFLVGIVAGAAVLVVAALVVAVRAPEADYRAGVEPEDIAFNYILAVDRQDYERAYGYVAPSVPGYPITVEQFIDDLKGSTEVDAGTTTTTVEDASIAGDRAVVTLVHTTFREGGLFESTEYSYHVEARLERRPEGWRMIDADMFWSRCWNQPQDCDDSSLRVPARPSAP